MAKTTQQTQLRDMAKTTQQSKTVLLKSKGKVIPLQAQCGPEGG